MGISTYDYDNASGSNSVADGTYSGHYAYDANSSLMDTVTFKQGSTNRMTTKRRYDFLGRTLSVVNTPTGAGQLPASDSYCYNQTNRRVQMTLADGSCWVYTLHGENRLLAMKGLTNAPSGSKKKLAFEYNDQG